MNIKCLSLKITVFGLFLAVTAMDELFGECFLSWLFQSIIQIFLHLLFSIKSNAQMLSIYFPQANGHNVWLFSKSNFCKLDNPFYKVKGNTHLFSGPLSLASGFYRHTIFKKYYYKWYKLWKVILNCLVTTFLRSTVNTGRVFSYIINCKKQIPKNIMKVVNSTCSVTTSLKPAANTVTIIPKGNFANKTTLVILWKVMLTFSMTKGWNDLL